MAVAKTIQAQRDFSSGQLDLSVKRADQDPKTAALLRAGARQVSNFRLLNSGATQNRSGRRIAFSAGQNARVEDVTISPGVVFRIAFAPGTLDFNNLAGANVGHIAGMPWQAPDLARIVWCVARQSIYITSPSHGTPQVATYDQGVWTVAPYTPQLTLGGQLRSPFYRLSPLGTTMQPSAATGAITMTFSPAVPAFNVGMVGTRLRFCNRQILVTGFTSTALLSGTVIEALPPGQTLKMGADPRNLFNLGDEVKGQTSGARAIVTALAAATMTVQLISNNAVATPGGGSTSQFGGGVGSPFGNTAATAPVTAGFLANEIVVGPGGSDQITNVGTDVSNTAPQAVAIWDDEVVNFWRGWPGSCFADQSRVGFCDIPALPDAIIWSAISAPTDLYNGDAFANSAMIERAPDKVQIYFVVPGPESSEFVFCDKKIYYILINAGNPLSPGRVGFQELSSYGTAQVRPRKIEESIVYMNAGRTSVMSIVAPGMTTRPYGTRNLSRLHSSLIVQPTAIAIPTAQVYEEQYIYVLNSNGTLAVGKYETENGQIKGEVGWVPWSGAGSVIWVAAEDQTVLFSSIYANGNIIETLDDSLYLDAAVFVNALPASLTPPAGRGPLWFWANLNVTLMDGGTRTLGTYLVDAVGNIIPQNRGGEDLQSPTLVAGQAWTGILEPFVPAVQTGADQLQRMRKRRVARAEIYVENSSGFVFRRFRSGQQGAHLPPGAVLVDKRVPAYNEGDDATQPPPLRERAYPFKPLGREHDPRVAVVKDTPGPLLVSEFGMEVTV